MRISAAPSPSSATTRRSGRASARPSASGVDAAHRAHHVQLVGAVLDRVQFAAAKSGRGQHARSTRAAVRATTSPQGFLRARALRSAAAVTTRTLTAAREARCADRVGAGPSARTARRCPSASPAHTGRPVASICAMARSSAGPIAAASVGNSSHAISMVSSIAGVIGPISACCGSSATPGWPRQVTISSCGRRNVQVSDVSGLTALPSPEFCIIAMPRRRRRSAVPGERDAGDQRHRIAFVRHRHVAQRRDPAARS